MSKRIACLGAAAAMLWAALPAAAADYDDGGDRPLAFQGGDGASIDRERARFDRRREVGPQDLGSGAAGRRAPGPVVFDERGPGRRFDRPAYAAPGDRRPFPIERPAPGYGYDRSAAFFPRGDALDEALDGDRPAPLYRPAAVPVGPGFGDGDGGPDVGCTIEQVQSTTPFGWRKIVTHRTCYRR